MNWTEACGFLGGFLTTVSMIPQLWKMVKTHRARDLSLTFTLLFAIGILFWLIYGIMYELAAVIFWNAIALILGGGLVYGKLKWGKR